jgi:hypothetical protein
MAQGLGLAGAQAALPQRREASSSDGLGRRERVESAGAVLEMLPEAFDQPSHDGQAGVQAQLLEGHYVRERLEPLGEPRRSHAA